MFYDYHYNLFVKEHLAKEKAEAVLPMKTDGDELITEEYESHDKKNTVSGFFNSFVDLQTNYILN